MWPLAFLKSLFIIILHALIGGCDLSRKFDVFLHEINAQLLFILIILSSSSISYKAMFLQIMDIRHVLASSFLFWTQRVPPCQFVILYSTNI